MSWLASLNWAAEYMRTISLLIAPTGHTVSESRRLSRGSPTLWLGSAMVTAPVCIFMAKISRPPMYRVPSAPVAMMVTWRGAGKVLTGLASSPAEVSYTAMRAGCTS